jgi:mannitol 2-dehydrogenase
MPIQLNQANLDRLNPQLKTPQYDRRRVGQSTMHIGVGGFHRAHQAVYAEDLFHLGEDLQWGLCGVGLLPHDHTMRDVMATQDCLYTLVERSSAGDTARVVGSITDYLFAPSNRSAVLERMASPDTKIVSLTITEGGYYIHSGTGAFDDKHPDVRFDLEHPAEPHCWLGFLTEALARRRQRGLAPFTVMSCDNVQGNGDVTKKTLLAFVELREPKLAAWIAQNSTFPNSMVDRITPATTDEHRAILREQFDVEDGWPVMTETFKQWVIEDHFSQGRPAWEKVGAQMTSGVLPYEKMKLRLLNASHQALCYIGMLFGYEFAHQTMEDADIRRLCELLLEEVTPVLPPVPGVDLAVYKRKLIERFANPAIRDQLSRIGIYGSSGMPKFVLPSIQDNLARSGTFGCLSFTVACWFRYLNGLNEAGAEITMKDPMAPRLRAIAKAAGKDPTPLLAVREIFSEELANAEPFVNEVRKTLASFYDRGARATLKAATFVDCK